MVACLELIREVNLIAGRVKRQPEHVREHLLDRASWADAQAPVDH